MTNGRPQIELKLERFILDELLDEAYGGGDPLATEAVDSLGHEQLVGYIEDEFGVRIADAEMVRENFESVPVLAAFIAARATGATA